MVGHEQRRWCHVQTSGASNLRGTQQFDLNVLVATWKSHAQESDDLRALGLTKMNLQSSDYLATGDFDKTVRDKYTFEQESD